MHFSGRPLRLPPTSRTRTCRVGSPYLTGKRFATHRVACFRGDGTGVQGNCFGHYGLLKTRIEEQTFDAERRVVNYDQKYPLPGGLLAFLC